MYLLLGTVLDLGLVGSYKQRAASSQPEGRLPAGWQAGSAGAAAASAAMALPPGE